MFYGANMPSCDYWTTGLFSRDVMYYACNWWPVKRTNLYQQVPGVPLPPLDPDGYPTDLTAYANQGLAVTCVPLMHNGGFYPAGLYTLAFDGTGTIVVSGGSGMPQTECAQTGSSPVERRCPIPGATDGGIFVSVTASDPSDHVRNIRLLMPDVDGQRPDSPFYYPFMEYLKPFTYLRFMDAMKTNGNQITDWSQRTRATYYTKTGTAGLPVETMVALCNEAKAWPWFNMPVHANEGYIRSFAQYVHDNLDDELLVYVEFGNELWNSGGVFHDAWQFVHDYSQAHGIGHNVAIADLSKWCWDIWRDVFGADQGPTLQRVAAGQFSVPADCDTMLTRLAATAAADDPALGFDVLSVAPYFAPSTANYNAKTTTAQLVDDLDHSIMGLAGPLNKQLELRAKWEALRKDHLPFICYEAGPELVCDPSLSWHAAFIGTQTHPNMWGVTEHFLEMLRANGVDGVNYYELVYLAKPTGKYAWGALQHLFEDQQAQPKYWAIEALANYHDNEVAGFIFDNPQDTPAGKTQSITVTAIGDNGGRMVGYLGTVIFSSTDPRAILPLPYTFRPEDQGQHTFDVGFQTLGQHSISVRDRWMMKPALVTPGATSKFVVAGYPSAVAGSPQQFQVTAADSANNLTPSYLGTVHFTTNDWQAGCVPADYTFKDVDKGTHTFTGTLKTANYLLSITATDTGNTKLSGTQSGIKITAGDPAIVVFGQAPKTATAGVPVGFSVRIQDRYNNLSPSFTGTVTFGSSDARAQLPPPYTFTGSEGGIANLSVTFNTPGTQRLNASAAALGSQANTNVMVSPAQPPGKIEEDGA
jgi:hypothetical protein